MEPRPLSEGTPLHLADLDDAETLVRACGTRYVVTDRCGNVRPPGARELGVFADDVRYLSHYELSIRNLPLVALSADGSDPAFNRIDLMVAGPDNEEFLDDPQHFLHVQRRQLVDDAFHEEIEIVNYLTRPLQIDVEISFASDFADMFEVRGAKRSRRGTLEPATVHPSAVERHYRGLDGRDYASRIDFQPQPTSLSESKASFRLALAAGAAQRLFITVEPRVRGAVEPRPFGAETKKIETWKGKGQAFDAAARERTRAAEEFLSRAARFHCDNLVLEHVLRQSSLDLHALTVPFQGATVLAAGIPWFCCPFGRDTLLAAYEALLFDPAIAASSLRALAKLQGRGFDEFTEEEPGKILHEIRFGEMAAAREIPHYPYYGSIDSTPLFVVVLHATYKATADKGLIADLAEALRAALSWIDRQSDEGRDLVFYAKRSPRGLDNQGWKDSRAGVSFPDARRAAPPIALAEVQGYCVDAYRRGAELLAVVGDETASVYRERAKAMAHRVDELLWMPAEQRYAFGLDGERRVIPTIVSNIGHLLWSRLPPPEKARRIADELVRPESLSPFGIRTLAAGQPVYNPLSYHNGTVWPHDNAIVAKGFANYNFAEDACRVFETIVRAMGHFRDHRLPELYCGMSSLVRYPVACSPQAWAAAAPFLLLQAVLGIHVDGPRRQLLVRDPRMPPSLNFVAIENLRVASSRVSLRLRRVGHRCHVDQLDVEGPPVRTFVEIE